ncbi:MAG: PD-(D/E)XK nuclease family protein [Candidatus Aenigmarchaeota archaeon]|nr:PD-(D/E)XK nuclease family protein [Candidatus Aenigmarchaeota archaeon]
MAYKLSPSSLSLMEDCPRCFWIHFNRHKQRPQGIFPSLPSGMDRILKEHFDRFMERGELPPELRENGSCNGFRLFDNKGLLKVWRNNFRGISWADSEENILHGAVDNIMVNGNKLIVLDYKTRGFPLKEDTAEHYRNQLDLYNFLLRKNGFETEDFAFLLFYVPREVLDSGSVVFDTTLVRMNVSVENAAKIWNRAISLLKGPCPENGGEKECEWCRLLEVPD